MTSAIALGLPAVLLIWSCAPTQLVPSTSEPVPPNSEFPKLVSPAIGYPRAMEEVRKAIGASGIPRQKVFYHFQLYGAESVRLRGGARGGYMNTLEHWKLRGGYSLYAAKHYRVGKLIPLKEGESFPPMSEESYYEEPLERFFDTLTLVDSHENHVAEIDLHSQRVSNPMPQRE